MGDMVACDACAFEYSAMHRNEDGTYSCPLCESARLRERVERLEAVLRDEHELFEWRGECNAEQPCPACMNLARAGAVWPASRPGGRSPDNALELPAGTTQGPELDPDGE